MKIVVIDQNLVFEDMSLKQIDTILNYIFSNTNDTINILPDWMIVALIDEKLTRNEQAYSDNW